MQEIFTNINGYDKYQISNFGNVKNVIRNRLLTSNKLKNGYYVVRIPNNDKKAETLYIHHLVAKSFLPHPPNDNCKIIDHIDRNKNNNKSNNLRYVNRQQNALNVQPKEGNQFKGIHRRKNGKYTALLRIKDKLEYLGIYKKPEEAALAYDMALILYDVNEYGYQNFPSTQ